MSHISPLAVVDSRAELDSNVEIGPFCVVGPHVQLGSGCRLDSHVVLTGHTTIGCNNHFHPNSVIGGEPQDYSYTGAPTRLEIGDDNTFREGVTVNRGAEKEDGVTRIGSHCMLMSNAHVGHNCHVQDNVLLVNGVLLGGHVHVHDGAIISGNAAVHHFATVGTLAFVGGMSRVTIDVPPYMLHNGNEDQKIVTINLVGLQRRGIPQTAIQHLKRAHRLLFRETQRLADVQKIFASELGESMPPELHNLFEFLELQQEGKSGRGGEVRRNQKPAPPATILAPTNHTGEEGIRRAA
jgi:UDP-N-acetylglucosamine acyltransferase